MLVGEWFPLPFVFRREQAPALQVGAVFAMLVGVGAHDDPHCKESNKKALPLGELSSACETERA